MYPQLFGWGGMMSRRRRKLGAYHCLYRSSNWAFHPSGTEGGGGPEGGANDICGGLTIKYAEMGSGNGSAKA